MSLYYVNVYMTSASNESGAIIANPMYTIRIYFAHMLRFIDLQNETHRQVLVQCDVGKLRHYLGKRKHVSFLFKMLFSHFRIRIVMHSIEINNKQTCVMFLYHGRC